MFDTTPAKLENIEVINLTSSINVVGETDFPVAVNLINAGQAQEVNNKNSTRDMVVTNIANGADLGVYNSDGDDLNTTFGFFDTKGVQTVDLTLSTILNGANINIAGVETLNVLSTGLKANVADLNTPDATTVNIAGTNNLDIIGSDLASATLIDATALSGDLAAELSKAGTLKGGSGDDYLGLTGAINATVHGQAGEDVIDVSNKGAKTANVDGGADDDLMVFGESLVANTATAKNNDVIDGGTGFDTLEATYAALQTVNNTVPNAVQSVFNVEALTATATFDDDVRTGVAGNLVTANVQAGIQVVDLVDGTTGAVGITFDSGVAGTVMLGEDLRGDLTVGNSGSLTTDSVTITGYSEIGDIDFLNGRSINVVGAESVLIQTEVLDTLDADPATQTFRTITGTAGVTAIKFAGAQSFEQLIGEDGITGGSIDASGLTGDASLQMAEHAVGVKSILGSANGDTLGGQADKSTTINGGAGDDLIVGGTAADLLNGDDGDDQIHTGGGADVVHAGEGDDTVFAEAPGLDAKDKPLTLTVRTEAGDDTVVINRGRGLIDVTTGEGDDVVRLDGEIAPFVLANYDGVDIKLEAGDDMIEIGNLYQVGAEWKIDGGTGTNMVATVGAGETLTNRDYVVLNDVLTNFQEVLFAKVDDANSGVTLDASKIANYKWIGLEGNPAAIHAAEDNVDAAQLNLDAEEAQLAIDEGQVVIAEVAVADAEAEVADAEAAVVEAEAEVVVATAERDAAQVANAIAQAQRVEDEAIQAELDNDVELAQNALTAAEEQLATDEEAVLTAEAALETAAADNVVTFDMTGVTIDNTNAYTLDGLSIGGVATGQFIITPLASNLAALVTAMNTAFAAGEFDLEATLEGATITIASTLPAAEQQNLGVDAAYVPGAVQILEAGIALEDGTLGGGDVEAAQADVADAEATRDAQIIVVDDAETALADAEDLAAAQQIITNASIAAAAETFAALVTAELALDDAEAAVVEAEDQVVVAVSNLADAEANLVEAEAVRDAQQIVVDEAQAAYDDAVEAIHVLVADNTSVLTKVAADQVIWTDGIVKATGIGHDHTNHTTPTGAALTVETEGRETYLDLHSTGVTLSVTGLDAADGVSVTDVVGMFGTLNATLTNGQVIDEDGYVVADTRAVLNLTSVATYAPDAHTGVELLTSVSLSGSGVAHITNENGSKLATVVSTLNGVSTVTGDEGEVIPPPVKGS